MNVTQELQLENSNQATGWENSKFPVMVSSLKTTLLSYVGPPSVLCQWTAH